MVGICSLCKKEKKLIRSHIIPEGFYTKTYDEYRRARYASKSREILKYMQKGYWEHLLCKQCDGDIIGSYDKYAIEVIRDKKHIKEQSYVNLLKWDNLDYNRFKLFHLSVLWRAHLSKENCRAINLTEEQAEQLRQYILSGKAPDEYEYPLYGLSLFDAFSNVNQCDEIITFGNCYQRLEAPDSKMFVFIYGGIAWHYIVPCAKHDDILQSLFLKKSKSFILEKQNLRDFPPFFHVFNSILMVGKSKK
jgi:hypothetical protein